MSGMTERVLRYIEESHGAKPDHLWEKAPEDAAFRHPRDKKWFGVLLTNVPRSRLRVPGEGGVDILDVKCDPLMTGSLVDGRGIVPGYHMNKEHWISLLLDGSVPFETVCALVDMSAQLTSKGQSKA